MIAEEKPKIWNNSNPDVTPTPTSDAELLAALNPEAIGLKADASGDSKSLDKVKDAWLAYRRSGGGGKWKLNPADQPAKAEAATDPDGDRVCAHVILDKYIYPDPVDMGKDFDWTFNPRKKGDPAYTEEWTSCSVSRMNFWPTLGKAYWKTRNEKYAKEWVAQMRDFAADQPVIVKVSQYDTLLWRTLDASIRMSGTWPMAYASFLNSPTVTADDHWLYLKLVNDHARRLMYALEFRPERSGNWVSAECHGLFTIAVMFPEFREASAWRETAIKRMTSELVRMVPPDGFQAELTPSYHYGTVSSYFDFYKLAKENNIQLSDEMRTIMTQMYRAPVMVMDQRGILVDTNDSNQSNARKQSKKGLEIVDDPVVRWAATDGKEGTAPPLSACLPYAGFYAMRSGWDLDDSFLFFRAGPTGHAHENEDMLQVVLRAWNRTLIFDPGNYTYDRSDWRRFTQGTASHNTIIVDGLWQHRGLSKVPVTQPVNNPWHPSPLVDYVAGTYNAGYQQSVLDPTREYYPQKWQGPVDKSITHTRRVINLKPFYVLLLDNMDGTGRHTIDAHFHLDSPAAKLDAATQTAWSENPADEAQLLLQPLDTKDLKTEIIQGQKEPLLGWMPKGHRPIPTVRFRKVQDGSATFATLLYPFRGAVPMATFSSLEVKGASGKTLVQSSTGTGNVWARTLTSSQETAEIVVAGTNPGTPNAVPVAMRFNSTVQPGEVAAEAGGVVLRKFTSSGGGVITSVWDCTAYTDSGVSVTSDVPARFVLSQGVGKVQSVLIYNAMDAPLEIVMKKPFALKTSLPQGQWMSLSSQGLSPVSAPALPRLSAAATK